MILKALILAVLIFKIIDTGGVYHRLVSNLIWRIYMSAIDVLMGMDKGLFKRKEKDITMRLSRTGQDVTFHIVEVDSEKATQLSEESLNLDANGGIAISTFDTKIKLIMSGCDTFRNKDLMEHFGAVTPKELIKKILTKDEISYLSDEISELGGVVEFDEGVDLIKN